MTAHHADSDDGFTLVELLVVMLIVGILAGIAIPALLDQRGHGYESQALSDMSNVRTAIESYATDHNGSYAGLDGANQSSTVLRDQGFRSTAWTTLTVTATATSYCVIGRHADLASKKYRLTSDRNAIQVETPDGPDCP